MDRDTAIGGSDARFPETCRTALERVREEIPGQRRLAEEAIIAAYWKSVYKYIRARRRETNENAKDLTQSFFAAAVASGTFGRYDAMPSETGKHYYFEIMLPGSIVGAIVGLRYAAVFPRGIVRRRAGGRPAGSHIRGVAHRR